jgi:hypothetical protein
VTGRNVERSPLVDLGGAIAPHSVTGRLQEKFQEGSRGIAIRARSVFYFLMLPRTGYAGLTGLAGGFFFSASMTS